MQGAPAMPLVKGVLGFHTELPSRQAWPETADVVERGVESCKVVATCC